MSEGPLPGEGEGMHSLPVVTFSLAFRQSYVRLR
jgi:hypothetical protein